MILNPARFLSLRCHCVSRMLARSLATGFGAFSVTNDLKTDAEAQQELERL